jgi:hypothetical protein
MWGVLAGSDKSISLEEFMKSRNLGIGLAVLASSLFLLAGTASAHGTAPAVEGGAPAMCTVHSLPSFVLQGEEAEAASVADIIEVECNPFEYGTGSKVKITASQLYELCKGDVDWYVPNPLSETADERGVSVELDADGNATVAVRGGPDCSAGEVLVVAHTEDEPFKSYTTSFTVDPPTTTTPGVYAMPETQVEDALSSGFATIIETEFADGSEKHVHIDSEELYDRCRIDPHLVWIRENGEVVEPEDGLRTLTLEDAGTPEVAGVELDNDGNAFVIVLGDRSCAEGESLIEADLEGAKPFTTYTTTFTIEPPRPTG